ncbi:cytochrome ubiquinol oxidase subunit I [Acinetobacter baumannii]
MDCCTNRLVCSRGRYRQPWSIGEILPTHLSASSLSTGDVWGSILALAAFYTVLLIIEMYLMIKFARLGPSSLHTGKYHFENKSQKQLLMGRLYHD